MGTKLDLKKLKILTINEQCIYAGTLSLELEATLHSKMAGWWGGAVCVLKNSMSSSTAGGISWPVVMQEKLHLSI
jgi:hypothetical protein